MNIQELRKKAEELDVKGILDESIRDTKSSYIDRLNNQLDEGKHGYGFMSKYKSKEYSAIKRKMNPKAKGRIDLKLTGAFRSKLYVRIMKYSLIARSRDGKNSQILKQYGAKVFILNDKNFKAYLNEDVFPIFNKKIKDGLQ